jgi:hypothetical protein
MTALMMSKASNDGVDDEQGHVDALAAELEGGCM